MYSDRPNSELKFYHHLFMVTWLNQGFTKEVYNCLKSKGFLWCPTLDWLCWSWSCQLDVYCMQILRDSILEVLHHRIGLKHLNPSCYFSLHRFNIMIVSYIPRWCKHILSMADNILHHNPRNLCTSSSAGGHNYKITNHMLLRTIGVTFTHQNKSLEQFTLGCCRFTTLRGSYVDDYYYPKSLDYNKFIY